MGAELVLPSQVDATDRNGIAGFEPLILKRVAVYASIRMEIPYDGSLFSVDDHAVNWLYCRAVQLDGTAFMRTENRFSILQNQLLTVAIGTGNLQNEIVRIVLALLLSCVRHPSFSFVTGARKGSFYSII